jgi:hypothetical protein
MSEIMTIGGDAELNRIGRGRRADARWNLFNELGQGYECREVKGGSYDYSLSVDNGSLVNSSADDAEMSELIELGLVEKYPLGAVNGCRLTGKGKALFEEVSAAGDPRAAFLRNPIFVKPGL